MLFFMYGAYNKNAGFTKHFAAVHTAMKIMFCFRFVLRQFGNFCLQSLHTLPKGRLKCKPFTVRYLHHIAAITKANNSS